MGPRFRGDDGVGNARLRLSSRRQVRHRAQGHHRGAQSRSGARDAARSGAAAAIGRGGGRTRRPLRRDPAAQPQARRNPAPARHRHAPDRDPGRLRHRDRGSLAPRRHPVRAAGGERPAARRARRDPRRAQLRHRARPAPQGLPRILPRLGRRGRSFGQAAARARASRPVRRDAPGEQPEAPARPALPGAARAGEPGDDGAADGLCRAGHRQGVRLARRRAALPHARADRGELVSSRSSGCG